MNLRDSSLLSTCLFHKTFVHTWLTQTLQSYMRILTVGCPKGYTQYCTPLSSQCIHLPLKIRPFSKQLSSPSLHYRLQVSPVHLLTHALQFLQDLRATSHPCSILSVTISKWKRKKSFNLSLWYSFLGRNTFFQSFSPSTFILNGDTRAELVPGHCTAVPRDSQRAHEPEKGASQVVRHTHQPLNCSHLQRVSKSPKAPKHFLEAFSCCSLFLFSKKN